MDRRKVKTGRSSDRQQYDSSPAGLALRAAARAGQTVDFLIRRSLAVSGSGPEAIADRTQLIQTALIMKKKQLVLIQLAVSLRLPDRVSKDKR